MILIFTSASINIQGVHSDSYFYQCVKKYRECMVILIFTSASINIQGVHGDSYFYQCVNKYTKSAGDSYFLPVRQ